MLRKQLFVNNVNNSHFTLAFNNQQAETKQNVDFQVFVKLLIEEYLRIENLLEGFFKLKIF
jgi:hypothetical protein